MAGEPDLRGAYKDVILDYIAKRHPEQVSLYQKTYGSAKGRHQY